jgi:hypothetical protein
LRVLGIEWLREQHAHVPTAGGLNDSPVRGEYRLDGVEYFSSQARLLFGPNDARVNDVDVNGHHPVYAVINTISLPLEALDGSACVENLGHNAQSSALGEQRPAFPQVVKQQLAFLLHSPALVGIQPIPLER